MGEKFFVWSLGGDYVCESCGTTGNEVILEQSDDGDWCLSYWVGCYGFDSVSSDEPDLVEKVEGIISAIVLYPDFSSRDEKDLREKIERIKGDNK
jgi:hypothetical protein